MRKNSIIRAENFAKKIIKLAAEDGLTVKELHYATNVASAISNNSKVEQEAIEKTDFPSTQISETCDVKGLFD